ncbi:hypothetical protein BLNAU_9209 [Blattamonas nauphoetae]|uniref:BRCT domain-containing protein n=1 Tax=Blattamonas nauphoetae TaxID=2049346 RepID=A0ABQ9XWK9_9EUKA|nr:hypothetical protein BLNAU_9209 [Blattamonas nauphoetae]
MSEISFAYHETSLPPTESPSFMSSSQTFDAFMESMLNNSDPSQEPSRKNDSLTRENIQLVQYEPMSLKEQTLLALTNDETVINHLHTSEHDSIAPILPQKRQESTRLPEIQTKPLSSTQFYLHGFGAKKEKKLLKNFPNQGFKVSKFDPDNTTLSKTDIVIIEHGSMPENDYPCPAVSLFYVTECARMGSLVDPFSHILFRPTSFVPPLAGFNQFVFYLSGFTEINQRRMIGTIVHLLDARTEVEIIKCTYAIIATSDPLTQSNELSMIQTKNSGILCVKEEWITDCISSGSLLSISEYSLGS